VLAISSSAGMGPLAGLDLAELRKGFDEKVIAMLTVLQAALPHHVSSPDEIAEAIALLTSNASITGSVLEVGGGARFVRL
jgi:hypothetical protein